MEGFNDKPITRKLNGVQPNKRALKRNPAPGRTRFRIYVVIVLSAISVAGWQACSRQLHEGDTGDRRAAAPRDSSWERSKLMPDLMVSAVEVLPAAPKSGMGFSLNIMVQNIGIQTSGAYDLRVVVRRFSQDTLFTMQTSRNKGLEPGQTSLAFSSTGLPAGGPGSYEVHAVISPYQYEDEKQENNSATRTFYVSP